MVSQKWRHRGISPNLGEEGCSTKNTWPSAALNQHSKVTLFAITLADFTQLRASLPSGAYQKRCTCEQHM